MPYTPEEYEKLKAAYKEELRQRKATIETARQTYLRQKAEWHLIQMQSALKAIGYSPEPPHPAPDATPSQPQAHEQSPTSPPQSSPLVETKTLF